MAESITLDVLAERLSWIATDLKDVKVNTTALATRVAGIEAIQLAVTVLDSARRERSRSLMAWSGTVITIASAIAYLILNFAPHIR